MHWSALIALIAPLGGCIDSFHGSNVQFDFSPGMPSQAPLGTPPTAAELPNDIHFTFYAFVDGADASGNPVGRLFAVQRFEIHKIVDVTSPCFIDVGEHVPHPGLHVSQYAAVIEQDTGISDPANPPPGATEQQKIDVATAVTRQLNVAALGSDVGLKVVSTASQSFYPPVAADCVDASGIPPARCTDEVSNQRRLAICQDFWKADPKYFEGTDRVLTTPLDGTTYGMVDGANPITSSPVGGAQFFVDTDLGGVTSYALYWQHDGMPDPGNLFLFGNGTMATQGVMHVHMTNPNAPAVTADVAIFADIDQSQGQF